MNEAAKYLPAEERRSAAVEAVSDLAAQQNPSDITATAIAQHMGLTQGALFRHFPSKDAILQALFLAHLDFVRGRRDVPRLLFGELRRPGQTVPKQRVQTLIAHHGERLRGLLAAGKARGERDARLQVQAAAMPFIGRIQGLVMQSLLAGDMARMRQDAPGVFAICRRGMGRQP